jgi:peptidoglycan/xylan/chitin deacetylase (PgdA/CDA1 family)
MIKAYLFRSVRTFHKIFAPKDIPDRVGIYFHNITEKEYADFGRVLDYFQKKEYIFCDPEEYLIDDGKKRIFLSFDDNHSEWLKAGHLLHTKGIKATFYCNTGPLRDISTISDIRAYFRRIDYSNEGTTMSSDEISILHDRYKQVIGSHTVNHVNLAAIPLSEAKTEILENKRHLEEITGSEVEHFSYPFGMRRYFNHELRKLCIEAGFKTVSNAIPGFLHGKTERYDIARTMWDFNNSLQHNIVNLKIDGRIFTGLTGKSSISYH